VDVRYRRFSILEIRPGTEVEEMKHRRLILSFVFIVSFIMLVSFPLGSLGAPGLTHFRSLSDDFAPASSTDHFVDNNSSDMDISPDKGSHSSFPNQQAGPDSVHDTLTEAGTLVPGTDVQDFVDQVTSLHDPLDKGDHSAFVNLQAYDSVTNSLTEENLFPPATITTGLTTIDAQDAASFNFSHDGQNGNNRLLIVRIMTDSGTDVAGTPTYGGVSLTLLDNTLNSGGKPRVIVYYLVNPTNGTNLLSGSFTGGEKYTVAATNVWGVDTSNPIDTPVVKSSGKTSPTTGSVEIVVPSESGDIVMDAFAYIGGTAPTVGALQTEQLNSELGGSGASGHWASGSSEPGNTTVDMKWETLAPSKDYVTVGFNINAGYDDDYELDLEVGWTGADYDEMNEYLCIRPVTGGGWPDEDIKVDVWNGAWTTVFTDLTPDIWNNISISAHLIDTTFEIRFVGGFEDLDPNQDTWEIDAVLLHVWTDPGTNHELDLEVQWTGLSTGETNEDLCIFTGALASENLTVDVWNGAAWDNLFMGLNGGSWNNISVKPWLTQPVFTIRFKGGSEIGDTTQSSWNIDVTLIHLYNRVPENSQQPTASNLDDSDNMYARLREYELTMYTSDSDGFSNLQLLRFSMYSNDRSTPFWTVQYNEDTGLFSEHDDPSDYVTLNAMASIAAKSSKSVNATFHLTISWNHPDVSDVDAKCYVVDASNENSTDWYEVNWDVETRLQAGTLDVDDKSGTANRGDIDGLFYASGTVSYFGSSLNPASSEVDVWVNSTEYGTSVGPWSDAALLMGQFNVTCFADNLVGLDTYHIKVVEEGAGEGGTDLLQAPVQVTYIADRIEFYDSGSDDGRVDYGTLGKTWWRARYEYDSSEVSGGLTASLTGAKGLLWNGTHWTFQEAMSSVTRIDYSVVSASETTHGLTVWNQAASDVSIIWDRIEILTTTADDSRVGVGDTAEIRVTARLEYGGHNLGASDSLYMDDSPMAWDTTRFEFLATQGAVGDWTYYVNSTGAFEATYGITVVNLNLNSVNVVWDRVQVVSYGVDDDRVNIGDNVSVNVTLQFEYDSAFVTVGTVTMNGFPCSFVEGGTWQHSHSESSVALVPFDTIATSNNDHGITVVNQNLQSVDVVWDSLTISISVTDTRIDVGTSSSVIPSAVYDYTGLGYDGNLTLDNTIFTYSTVGERFYTVASAGNDTYGITAISTNQVVSVIWDRLVVDYDATDRRCDINTMQDVHVTVEYAFDSSPLTNSFGSVSLNGELMIWEDVPQQWSRSYMFGLPTTVQFSVTSITDTQFDLSAISYFNNETEIDIIWDRLQLHLSSNASVVNYGDWVNFTVTATRQADGSRVSQLSVSIERNGTFYASSNFTDFYGGTSEIMRRYVVVAASDTQYNLNVFIPDQVEVRWTDRPVVAIDAAYADDSDGRADVNTTISIYFHCIWSTNSSSLDSGTLFVNGTPRSIDSSGWVLFTNSSATVARFFWNVTGVDVNTVTEYDMRVALPSIIWDTLIVTIDVTDSRINIGDVAPMTVSAVYEYDSTPFDGTLFLNDTTTQYFTVGRRGYTVASTSGDSYGITLITVNSEAFVIWDSLVVDISVVDTRIDVGATASIGVSGNYSYDNAAFDGVLTLNDTTVQLFSVGRLVYTVSQASFGTHGITEIEVNDIEYVIWDRLEVYWSETQSERVAVGANVEVRFKVRYEYDAVPFTGINGELQINDLDAAYSSVGLYWYLTVSKDSVGAFDYEVSGFTDSTHALTVLMNASTYAATAVFDSVYVDGAGFWEDGASVPLSGTIEARIEEIVTLYFYLKYQSDGTDVSGAGSTLMVNGVPASYVEARGRWEVTVTSSTASTIDYEVSSFEDGFGITQIDQGPFVPRVHWLLPSVPPPPPPPWGLLLVVIAGGGILVALLVSSRRQVTKLEGVLTPEELLTLRDVGMSDEMRQQTVANLEWLKSLPDDIPHMATDVLSVVWEELEKARTMYERAFELDTTVTEAGEQLRKTLLERIDSLLSTIDKEVGSRG